MLRHATSSNWHIYFVSTVYVLIKKSNCSYVHTYHMKHQFKYSTHSSEVVLWKTGFAKCRKACFVCNVVSDFSKCQVDVFCHFSDFSAVVVAVVIVIVVVDAG